MAAISGQGWDTFQWWNTLSNVFLIMNIALALFILFYERKRPTSAWAWITVLFFLPVIGLVLFFLFGKPLNRKRLKKNIDYSYPAFQQVMTSQKQAFDSGNFRFPSDSSADLSDVVYMHIASGASPLTDNNQIEFFTDGEKKFEALFHDIEQAKDHIHFQYYIFNNDELGNRMIRKLTEKARQGVKVLVLFDAVGSKNLTDSFFEEFREAGGKSEPFLPSKIRIANVRINHRNHRKIVVIDGSIGYIGGFNVGDEYLGKDKKLGYWRDTHLRIQGDAVHFLQNRFLEDWNVASRSHPVRYASHYFPPIEPQKGVPMQIVASGPDTELDQIKNGFLKLITRARKSVFIQTPYFIPDTAILDALRTAALSGVDVRIMVPNKSDHPFIHDASLSFLSELLEAGVTVYTYANGFLHAKMIVVDEQAFAVGSANMDIRSFSLNFEVHSFIYCRLQAGEAARIFFQDVDLSDRLTEKDFEQRSLYKRGKQRIGRLLAPIL